MPAAHPTLIRRAAWTRRATAWWLALTFLPAVVACSSKSPSAPTTVGGNGGGTPSVTAPTITSQPGSRSIASGETAILSVGADGSGPLAYQWYAGLTGNTSSPAVGSTSSTFTTPALTSTTSYWVRVSNAAGAADSATATVTVSPPAGTAPVIVTQPLSQTVTAGQPAFLSVTAAGTAPLSYQWYSGASGSTAAPVSGATADTLTTPPMSASATFWVRVTNAHGSADSSAAVITVAPDAGVLAFEDQVLTLVNQYRSVGAVCGSTPYPPTAPLLMNGQLRLAARGHSQDMAANSYFSHTSLDGRTFNQRITAAGYSGSPLGENIAAGYPTPQAVVAGWMASPGHCSNIMSGSYRSIGVGYAFLAGSAYGHYWTQDFGGS